MTPSDFIYISTKRHLKVQTYIRDKKFSIFFVILLVFKLLSNKKKRIWGHNGPFPSGNVRQKHIDT